MPKKSNIVPILIQHCSLCGCQLNRDGRYGDKSLQGRSHATSHHCIPHRFGKLRQPVSEALYLEWTKEQDPRLILCYDCHEELLHNIILLPEHAKKLKEVFCREGASELNRAEGYDALRKRIGLLQRILEIGIDRVYSDEAQLEKGQ